MLSFWNHHQSNQIHNDLMKVFSLPWKLAFRARRRAFLLKFQELLCHLLRLQESSWLGLFFFIFYGEVRYIFARARLCKPLRTQLLWYHHLEQQIGNVWRYSWRFFWTQATCIWAAGYCFSRIRKINSKTNYSLVERWFSSERSYFHHE